MAARIGDMLVAAGFVSDEQVSAALEAQRLSGRRLGEELVALGLVSEVQLTQVLSNQLSVPWVSLHHVELTRELLDLVPAQVADRFGLIPVYRRVVRREGETLFVAMDDPTQEVALREVARCAGLPVKPMVAPPTDIRNAIRVYYLGLPPLAPPAPEVPKPPAKRSPVVLSVEAATGANAPRSAHADEAASTESPREEAGAQKVADGTAPVDVKAQAAVDAKTPAKPKADSAKAAKASAAEARAVTSAASDEVDGTAAAPGDDVGASRPADRPTAAGGAAARGFITLTLLDGTTVRLPSPRGRAAPTEPSRPSGLTGSDLVRALLAKGQGADVGDVLDDAQWEVLFATLLQLVLKKGLIADWEFVEAYQKNRGT